MIKEELKEPLKVQEPEPINIPKRDLVRTSNLEDDLGNQLTKAQKTSLIAGRTTRYFYNSVRADAGGDALFGETGGSYFPIRLFADGSSLIINFSFRVPDGFTSISSIKILWSTNASSGNMYWNAYASYASSGETFQANSNSDLANTTATGGSNIINWTTLALTTGIDNNDIVGIRFNRDASNVNDTLSSAVQVYGIEVVYQ